MRGFRETGQPEHGLLKAQERICESLVDNDGVLPGSWTNFKVHREHPEAPEALVKVNAEVLYGDPEREKAVVEELIGLILLETEVEKEVEIDFVVGVPDGARGFAKGVVDKLVWDLGVQVAHLDAKKNADGSFTVPPPPEGQGRRVVVVEDVMTTGSSSAKLVEVLQRAGYEVVLVVALVDREQGGPKRLEKLGVRAVSSFKLKQLLRWVAQHRPQVFASKNMDIEKVLAAEKKMTRFLQILPN